MSTWSYRSRAERILFVVALLCLGAAVGLMAAEHRGVADGGSVTRVLFGLAGVLMLADLVVEIRRR